MEKAPATIVIRAVKPADLPRVQAMVEDLVAAYPCNSSNKPNVSRTAQEFERHPEKGRLLVFEDSGRLVGYAIIVFFWSNEFGGDVLEIDEIYVDSSMRGSGLAKTFFTWLDEAYPQARAKSLQVSGDNEGARRLYERLGFKLSKNQHMFQIR